MSSLVSDRPLVPVPLRDECGAKPGGATDDGREPGGGDPENGSNADNVLDSPFEDDWRWSIEAIRLFERRRLDQRSGLTSWRVLKRRMLVGEGYTAILSPSWCAIPGGHERRAQS